MLEKEDVQAIFRQPTLPCITFSSPLPHTQTQDFLVGNNFQIVPPAPAPVSAAPAPVAGAAFESTTTAPSNTAEVLMDGEDQPYDQEELLQEEQVAPALVPDSWRSWREMDESPGLLPDSFRSGTVSSFSPSGSLERLA